MLGKTLTVSRAEAVLRAHKVGEGKAGADGTLAKIGNYTEQQKREKVKILRGQGFDKAEVRRLMELGVAGKEVIPNEDILLSIFASRKQFPRLFAESLKSDNEPGDILQRQAKLMEKLREVEEFQELKKQQPQELLTIKIVSNVSGKNVEQVLDPTFLKKYGEELADMVPSNMDRDGGASRYFLSEVRKILSRPALMTPPGTLGAALANTITDKVLKGKIFKELKEGKFDLLAENLPRWPEQFGFDPGRLVGLERGKDKEYYLGVLKDAFEADKRLDKLMALSIFSEEVERGSSVKNYLREIDEGKLDFLIDPQIRGGFLEQFTKNNNPADAKVLKRVLDARLKNYGRKLYSHKIEKIREITEEDSQLSLVEVPPQLGIFRGNVGGDCATSHSFGYANSPMERVFIIRNKRGEDVGYVNGTHVTLPDGEKGFFINTIAGANISGAMTNTIFAGIEKAKKSLGAKKIVLLGSRQEKGNINYTPIRDSYQKHRGKVVRISFPDDKVRETVEEFDKGGYDSAKHLEEASYLRNTDKDVQVFVEGRDRGQKQKFSGVDEFLEKTAEISEEELRLIFLEGLLGRPLPVELLKKALKRGFDIKKFEENNPILIYYVREGNATPDGFKQLVEMGADTRAKNRFEETVLHHYAKSGNATPDGFKQLVKMGADINAKNIKEDTTLHYYARSENATPDGFKQLVKIGADVKAKNRSGETILHYYAKSENATLDVFKQLVEMGADVKAKNIDGETALDYYAKSGNATPDGFKQLVEMGADVKAKIRGENTILYYYAMSGNATPDGFKQLFEMGVDASRVKDGFEETVLHYYAKSGNATPDGFKQLVEMGGDVKAKNGFGETVLHHYAKSGNATLDGFKQLVEVGADVNAKNKDGATFLYHYARSGNATPDGFKQLVEMGADIKAKNKNGGTALHEYAISINPTPDGFKQLVEMGVDIKAKEKTGETALHEYARSGNATLDGIKQLVEMGADVKARGVFERTVLHYYASSRNATPDGFKQLVKMGADINAGDKYGETVLHYYAKSRNATLEGFKQLVEMGADIDDAKTVLRLMQYPDPEIVKLLTPKNKN